MSRAPMHNPGSLMYWHQAAEFCRDLSLLFMEAGDDRACTHAIILQVQAETILSKQGALDLEPVFRMDGRWWYHTVDRSRIIGSWDTFIEAHEAFDTHLTVYLLGVTPLPGGNDGP